MHQEWYIIPTNRAMLCYGGFNDVKSKLLKEQQYENDFILEQHSLHDLSTCRISSEYPQEVLHPTKSN